MAPINCHKKIEGEKKMKNKTYIEPTLEFNLFSRLDVVMESGADFNVGDLLADNTGGIEQ